MKKPLHIKGVRIELPAEYWGEDYNGSYFRVEKGRILLTIREKRDEHFRFDGWEIDEIEEVPNAE